MLVWSRGGVMTEPEWLACEDPAPMLESLAGTAGARKLRLFAVACCRRGARCVPWAGYLDALDAAEAHADGAITDGALEGAYKAARAIADIPKPLPAGDSTRAMEYADWVGAHAAAALCVRDMDAAAAASVARWEPGVLIGPGVELSHEVHAAQSDLVRDVFGNPFRPSAIDPAWRTSTVLALARGMYESRDFGAMPILADALQDAGCDSGDVLSHCRGSGPHVRGCWVVDLVLGKV